MAQWRFPICRPASPHPTPRVTKRHRGWCRCDQTDPGKNGFHIKKNIVFYIWQCVKTLYPW